MQVVVHFEGQGSGAGELSWGQLEILGAMRRQRAWLALPDQRLLRPGTTVPDVIRWVRYLMARHQVLRTRFQFPADGPPRQVVHRSGDITLELVDAGDQDPADVAEEVIQRHLEHTFDLTREWPILVAAVLVDGVPVCRVFTVCHVVWDAFGALALLADLQQRGAAGGAPLQPITAMQPLEQARWQRSPAGQRHNEAVLRQWTEVLRQMPAQRFPAPVDRGEPRHWRIEFVSPATHLAIRTIRGRTKAGSAQVILALFLVALARVTGINPSVTRVAVNNRFRPGLGESVSITSQYGLCMVDVADATFDEALARLNRRIMATFKNAYYDPVQVAELVDRIGRERGEELDIHCYYNDRRMSQQDQPVTDPPTAAEVTAALPATTIAYRPLTRRGSERLFAAIEEVPDSFHLMIEADTWYLSQEAMVACAYAMQEMAVAAALDPTASTGIISPQPVPPR